MDVVAGYARHRLAGPETPARLEKRDLSGMDVDTYLGIPSRKGDVLAEVGARNVRQRRGEGFARAVVAQGAYIELPRPGKAGGVHNREVRRRLRGRRGAEPTDVLAPRAVTFLAGNA